MRKLENILVIIRSVGERTETISRAILENQVPRDQVVVVNEVPFSAAMRKSFQLGIERNKEFTLCVDADVLVAEDAVERLMTHFSGLENHVCEIQAQVLDKLTGKVRAAGNHLYRTALLPEVISRIPNDGESVRPEHFTLNQMKQDGYPWVEFRDVIGVHDYEQYYRDVFRKAFVYAHKHVRHLPLILERWRDLSSRDPDFAVALWGLASGIASVNQPRISMEEVPYEDYSYFAGAEWREKELLQFCDLQVCVESEIAAYFENGGDYLDPQYNVVPGDPIRPVSQSFLNRLRSKLGRVRSRFAESKIRS